MKCRKGGVVLFAITNEQGEYLVKLARQVIENKLGLAEIPDKNNDPVLMEKCGAFVTLNLHARGANGLRGCIGLPYPIKSLTDAVIESAENSAFNDPRFPPVQKDEIKGIIIEVSILTPPKLIKVDDPIKYPKHIKVGRDGLIIAKGWRRGLLLPQVPIEWGWKSCEFISQCCIKAGLHPYEWKKRGTEVYKFQAILYKEDEPLGNITRHIIDSE